MAIEASSEQTREPRIRLGMVGGGAGAFIGAVHRIAARIDDQYDLIAGALSSTPEKAVQSGRDLGLDPSRTYSSYREMAIREAKLKNGIEAVAIVTPNHVHYDAAKEFLRRGIHVICDKPLTSNLADAKKLKKIADESGALFVLTHNYTGYPMVRQAREMIANGDLGKIRVVQVEYQLTGNDLAFCCLQTLDAHLEEHEYLQPFGYLQPLRILVIYLLESSYYAQLAL